MTGRVHHLKIKPEFFERVGSWQKSFEIRKNDRDFQVGDEVVLRELSESNNPGAFLFSRDGLADPESQFSGREVWRRIGYIHAGYGMAEGFVVLGLEKGVEVTRV